MPTLLLPVPSSLTPSSPLEQDIVAHLNGHDVVTLDALINQLPQYSLCRHGFGYILDTRWMSGDDGGFTAVTRPEYNGLTLRCKETRPISLNASPGTLNVYAEGGEPLWSANCAEPLSCSLRSSFS